jgi:small basic protein
MKTNKEYEMMATSMFIYGFVFGVLVCCLIVYIG